MGQSLQGVLADVLVHHAHVRIEPPIATSARTERPLPGGRQGAPKHGEPDAKNIAESTCQDFEATIRLSDLHCFENPLLIPSIRLIVPKGGGNWTGSGLGLAASVFAVVLERAEPSRIDSIGLTVVTRSDPCSSSPVIESAAKTAIPATMTQPRPATNTIRRFPTPGSHGSAVLAASIVFGDGTDKVFTHVIAGR